MHACTLACVPDGGIFGTKSYSRTRSTPQALRSPRLLSFPSFLLLASFLFLQEKKRANSPLPHRLTCWPQFRPQVIVRLLRPPLASLLSPLPPRKPIPHAHDDSFLTNRHPFHAVAIHVRQRRKQSCGRLVRLHALRSRLAWPDEQTDRQTNFHHACVTPCRAQPPCVR